MYKVQIRRKKKIKQSRCACGHCSLHRDLASFLDFRALTEFTLVSVTAFSRSLSLSWEEELAEALSSLALILCSSSSSFSRSFSKVWAQLSHSGILQETAGLAKDHVQCIADYMSQCQASVLFLSIHLGSSHQCLCLQAPVCFCKLEKNRTLSNISMVQQPN